MTRRQRKKDGKAKGSLTGLLAAVAVLTVIAGGGGWYLGGMISADQLASAKPSGKEDKPKQGDFESRSIGTVVPLQPIITNLGIPQNTGCVSKPRWWQSRAMKFRRRWRQASAMIS